MLMNDHSVFQGVRANLNNVDDPGGQEEEGGGEDSNDGNIDPGG